MRCDVLFSRGDLEAPRHRVEEPYGSALAFPRGQPWLCANFVSTIDGVAVFGRLGGSSAGLVGMDSEIDRHVMALLRSQVDAVLIGSGTMRAAAGHQWTARGLVPDLGREFDQFRKQTRQASAPATLYVVTASGKLDSNHVAFTHPQTDVVVVTTARGAATLPRLHASVHVEVLTRNADVLEPGDVVRLIRQRSGELILCEGGPTLMGQLLSQDLVDELFLTLAPQLAGRDRQNPRQGIVDSYAALPQQTPRAQLDDLRRSHNHLFLRYRLAISTQPPHTSRVHHR